MSLAELKNSYLAKCETDWERSKRDCLGRLRDNFGDGKYAKLALRILALTPDVFRKFCGVNITAVAPHGYGYAHLGYGDSEFMARMGFVSYFIGHQLLDDGEPAVAWVCFDWYENAKLVSEDYKPADDEENYRAARPYIHSCVDVLRQTFPDAKLLDLDETNKVLDWYEREKREMNDWMTREVAEGFEDQETLDYKNSETEIWVKFAQELWDEAHRSTETSLPAEGSHRK